MNLEKWIENGIEQLKEEFGEEKVEKAIEYIKNFEVEVPSWVFGNFGGGRFGNYTPPGFARNIYEKIDDASLVHKLTGCTPRIATHILWDFSKDGYEPEYKLVEDVYNYAKQKGISLGAINPTYFLGGSYRGSFTAIEKETRKRYIEQTIFGGEIAKKYGNKLLTLWFPDGSLYPGQIEIREAYERMKESLIESYKKIPKDVKVLIEYKVFEPGTYSTTIPDWGTSYVLAKNLGENAGVLIDLGHHWHGTNIEQIVSILIAEKVLGGFHFNTKYAADDDHAVEPNLQMARIFYELVKGEVICNKERIKNWEYMIDQACGRENRFHAILHSIDSLQISLAKGVLVDIEKIKELQERDEIILANRTFNSAISLCDVRPIVLKARLEKNVPIDPIGEYIKSGYQEKIEKERK
ncbi:MAG: L-rhamnose isomerase [bacterium]|nr:L-rhamnose isomerase [bacterium]MCX7917897.1 L-rhamnose isomerase [bacterium]MDW8163919.1 L-rhamnose isomerase [Candidatus Omnitrophota bacterium]